MVSSRVPVHSTEMFAGDGEPAMRSVLALALCTSLLFYAQPILGQQYGSSNCVANTSVADCSCSNCSAERTPALRYLCDPPGCNSRTWVDVNYLLFFTDGFRVPELVAGSAAGTPRTDVGILGNPATNVLLGNEYLGSGSTSGVQIGFGRYLDDCGNLAITGSLFTLGNSDSVTYPGGNNSIVSRPFFNVDPSVNGLDAELVNFPGVVTGSITVANDTDLFSGGIGLQKRMCCTSDGCSAHSMDAYFGYRAFAVDDSLVISEALETDATSGFLPVGTTFDVVDRFETENRFHGVEFGMNQAWQRQRWTFEAGTRIALGNVNQRVRIDGSTTITVPGVASAVQPYGILAGPSNIGVYERDRFGVLTDSRLEIGYQVSCRLKLQLGYNMIFLNDVARAGDFVDLNVNGTLIDPNVADSGPARPAFNWESKSLILHGLNFGFELTF